MCESNIENRIRDLLQKHSYSNDNKPSEVAPLRKEEHTLNGGISIVGNNNIIIEANLFYTTFIFIASCLWLWLMR